MNISKKKIIKKILKILLSLILVFSVLLGYLYYKLSTEKTCYGIGLHEGTDMMDRIIKNKILSGQDSIFDVNLNNRLLVSYDKVQLDEEESFLILNYIDQSTKKELSVRIFEDCTIEWLNKHSETYGEPTIIQYENLTNSIPRNK